MAIHSIRHLTSIVIADLVWFDGKIYGDYRGVKESNNEQFSSKELAQVSFSNLLLRTEISVFPPLMVMCNILLQPDLVP